VLVSHNHYDQMDVATVARLWRRDKPRIIVPLGNDAIIRSADASIAVEVGDWGDSFRLNDRVVVQLRRVHHWSARGIKDRRHALWSAFVIDEPGGGIYFVGDTGFGDGSAFRNVRRARPRLRLALLPIGAYEPRWFMKTQHMKPAEAVEDFRLCGAKQAIGHHWGTFRLADEGYDDPPRKLTEARCCPTPLGTTSAQGSVPSTIDRSNTSRGYANDIGRSQTTLITSDKHDCCTTANDPAEMSLWVNRCRSLPTENPAKSAMPQ
jgi:L-ascorbate metabolism protein UlaG (beta-lactamase superfamily)